MHHGGMQNQNQFGVGGQQQFNMMHNKHNFTKNAAFNAVNQVGEYEYEIDLPK